MAKGSRHICGNPNALALRHDGQAWCRPWHPRRPDSVHTAWYSPHSDGPASVPRLGARCLRMHAIASCPSSSSTQVTKNRNTCHPNVNFTTLRRSPVNGSTSCPRYASKGGAYNFPFVVHSWTSHQKQLDDRQRPSATIGNSHRQRPCRGMPGRGSEVLSSAGLHWMKRGAVSSFPRSAE